MRPSARIAKSRMLVKARINRRSPMRKLKGGRIKRLIGSAEAMPPNDSPWEWAVRWDGGDPLARGTASSRRQAVRSIGAALGDALAPLDCYCILSDGENLDLRTEYYRVIEVFIPG
jgi:hypothetical protein